MLSELLNFYRLYLRSNHIFVYESWLTECLEYLLKSCKNNLEAIPTKVLDQWLLHDLTEISPGCLPQNLKNDNTSVLHDVYTLQIKLISNYENYVGMYSKITKKLKKEINRGGQHDLEKRYLILFMTDGVQNIMGYVLEPIKDLWINTVPGCKMLIKGPVHFDSGFLILNDDNCELLGGEVDTLMRASYDYTVNQLNLLKIQSLDLDVTVTDPNNDVVDLTSVEDAARNKRRRSSNRSVEPVNKRIKTEAVNNNHGVNNLDLDVTVTDPNNDVVDLTSVEDAARNKRRRSSNRSVEPVNKRIKTEAVNNNHGVNNLDLDVTVTDPNNDVVNLTSVEDAARNKRRRSSSRSVEPVNKGIKTEAVNNNHGVNNSTLAAFVDLTCDYESGGSRIRRENTENDLTIRFEQLLPDLSFILKHTK